LTTQASSQVSRWGQIQPRIRKAPREQVNINVSIETSLDNNKYDRQTGVYIERKAKQHNATHQSKQAKQANAKTTLRFASIELEPVQSQTATPQCMHL
jgi:hypothetical protein